MVHFETYNQEAFEKKMRNGMRVYTLKLSLCPEFSSSLRSPWTHILDRKKREFIEKG